MIRVFCKFTTYILIKILYRHKVYGKENIRLGGAMIAPNHTSFLDPPIVGASFPGAIHFLARDSLFHFAPFGWLIRKLNTHPVSRGKGNLNTLKKAMEIIQSGEKIVIFPEGKRSSNGALHKAQLGVGMLVQRTQCRVVPVYIYGAFAIWNTKRKFPKFWGKTACVFGTPLEYSEIQAEDKKEAQTEIATKIMDKIAHLKEWYEKGAKGTPP
ncbi:MAG: 1-acyl-sn-glycerol-3-phosphate acyltransferase [Chlamydiales bacterium]|nr:1-acyl-sn-glycerol-3-phosphate acyltransferase [Chlamydiales bacterium]